MHHIVCFSGGHSSALVAIAVVGRYGREAVTLLNHNIHPSKEHHDIKRFKMEVAAFLGVPITYANIHGITDEQQLPNQFEVILAVGAFKQPGTGTAFCTYYLKTKPFQDFLELNHPVGTAIIYYGFDDDEQHRIQRRRSILGAMGYDTCFPLAEWPDTLESTQEVGIAPPLTYTTYKHGNCAGCPKGGLQHWYVTFCHRPDVYDEADQAEQTLGYTINRDRSGGEAKPYPLSQLRTTFRRMKCNGVPSTEHYPEAKFAKYLKMYKLPKIDMFTGCDCAF